MRSRITQCIPGVAAMVLALAVVGLVPAHAADTRDTTLSKEDQACLECHAKPGLRKTLPGGESLSLYVSPKGFAESLHNSSNCEGCHSDIDAKTHGKPGGEKAVANRRSHSVEAQETCRDCHKKAMKLYDDGMHAVLVRAGDAKAPLCADCHDPHATRSAKKAAPGETTVLCRQCHKPLAEAFAASVHGQGAEEQLECKDCHRSHNIKAAQAGDHLAGQCISCHRDDVTAHAQWLPNTDLHLEAVACPACHVVGAARRVDLRLYERTADRKSAEKVGVPQFIQLTSSLDANAAGVDGRALWSLLQELNRDGAGSRTYVRGRLEVSSGVQAHALAPKAKAIKDCASCHSAGGAAFQSVTVSMIGPDGRPVRKGASGGLLNSLESIGAVGGFYAIGSNRIKLLDVLLVAALAVGILVPATHLGMRLMAARKSRRTS